MPVAGDKVAVDGLFWVFDELERVDVQVERVVVHVGQPKVVDSARLECRQVRVLVMPHVAVDVRLSTQEHPEGLVGSRLCACEGAGEVGEVAWPCHRERTERAAGVAVALVDSHNGCERLSKNLCKLSSSPPLAVRRALHDRPRFHPQPLSGRLLGTDSLLVSQLQQSACVGVGASVLKARRGGI